MEKSFLVMPEGCRWSLIKAASAELAYRSECCWWAPDRKTAVMDVETGQTAVFTHENDEHGNIMTVHELDGHLLEEPYK